MPDLRDRLGFSCLFVARDLWLVKRMGLREAVGDVGRIVELAPERGALRPAAPPLHAGAPFGRAAAGRSWRPAGAREIGDEERFATFGAEGRNVSC